MFLRYVRIYIIIYTTNSVGGFTVCLESEINDDFNLDVNNKSKITVCNTYITRK